MTFSQNYLNIRTTRFVFAIDDDPKHFPGNRFSGYSIILSYELKNVNSDIFAITKLKRCTHTP